MAEQSRPRLPATGTTDRAVPLTRRFDTVFMMSSNRLDLAPRRPYPPVMES